MQGNRKKGAFTVYFDDSGTSPQNPIAVVGGWISPAEQWKKFEREWTRIQEAEGFHVLHMADFMFGSSRTEFGNWNNLKKNRVIRALRKIIQAHCVYGFGFSVHKQDYDEIVSGDVRAKCGRFHYTWAVRMVLGKLERWRQDNLVREPIQYVFDRMSEGRYEIDKVFADAENTGDAFNRYGIYPGCYSFQDKSDVLPLQAADLIAWLVYQRALNHALGKPPHRITAETFNAFNKRHLDSATISRAGLADFVEKVRKVSPQAGIVVWPE
jgi:Protein of unknown function (DUF3800)